MSKEVKIFIGVVSVVFLFFLSVIIGYGIKLSKEKGQREQQILAQQRIEQQRLAEEQKLEQQKLAEQQRVEQERIAEEQRLEQQRIEQEKLSDPKYIEQQRLAEKQRLEQQRIAEQQRLDKIRKEKIESQFSIWDGKHINLTNYIKKNLKDPDSFQHIETEAYELNDMIIIVMKYRAKNSFGGYVVESVAAEADLDGNLISVEIIK